MVMPTPTLLHAALPKPVFLYDGGCGFCRRWVARWKARVGDAVWFAPQRPALRWLLGVRKRDVARASQFIEPGGRRSAGARAVFRMLQRGRGRRAVATALQAPGLIQLAELAYKAISANRKSAGVLDRLLFGRTTGRASHRRVHGIWFRGLGAVYLLAFTSFRSQAKGLIGERGILPARELLENAGRRLEGADRWARAPTALWLKASDSAIDKVIRAGQLAGAAMVLGVAPPAAALVAYAAYLSLVTVGQEFLSFQWDALLLEGGALTAATAPWALSLRRANEPSVLTVALMRWLAFRFLFESGVAKWQSRDETWRNFTALSYYYETAPLPSRLGVRAHHLPMRVHKLNSAATLALECGLPFLYLGPRRVREAAFAATTGLQVGIAATGNYGYFNILSSLVGLWALDDRSLGAGPHRPRMKRRLHPGDLTALVFGVPYAVLTFREFAARMGHNLHMRRALNARPGRLPLLQLEERLDQAERRVAPFRVVNPYGLFAVMTTSRPEISIEGSNDGFNWTEYPFRYKVQDVNAPPKQVAPHMPRLDWQMWFAALGPAPSWFHALITRLLEGTPEVLRLFERDPFDGTPPRYVRAVLYDYRLTTPEQKAATSAWWQRTRLGLYLPVVTLRPDEPEPEAVAKLSPWVMPRGQA